VLDVQAPSVTRSFFLCPSAASDADGDALVGGHDRNLTRFLALAGALDVASAAWLCPLTCDGRIGSPIAEVGEISPRERRDAIALADSIPNLAHCLGTPLWLPDGGSYQLCSIGNEEAGRAFLFLRHRAWHPTLPTQTDAVAEKIRQLVHIMWIMRGEAQAPDIRALSTDVTSSIDTLAGPLADQCPFGIMVMDVDQYLHLTNKCAAQLLDESSEIGLVENRFVIADAADAIRVQVTIRAVLMGKACASNRRTVAISGPDRAPLLLSISKLADGPDGTRACVIMTRPGCGSEADVHPLAELFGLTPVETRLVSQLVRGLSVQEAARALQLKVQTVRTYLKLIFQKTGTHRQVELVQLMQNGALPVLS
jgi:DNA-binding CsgD family transcriptional regulator